MAFSSQCLFQVVKSIFFFRLNDGKKDYGFVNWSSMVMLHFTKSQLPRIQFIQSKFETFYSIPNDLEKLAPIPRIYHT